MKIFSRFNIKTVFLNLDYQTKFFTSNKTMYYKTGIFIDLQCQNPHDFKQTMINVNILFYQYNLCIGF